MTSEQTTEDPQHLERECGVFSRYLAGIDASRYVVDRYMAMSPAVHRQAGTFDTFDRTLVEYARCGPVRARIADAYARIFRPTGLLRRKLILAFAILENCPEVHRSFTSGGSGSVWFALWRIIAGAATFSACLAAGLAIFAPRQLLGPRGGGSQQ